MKKIIQYLRMTFASHQWISSDDLRTCRVCGKREEFINDHPTGYWEVVRAGDRTKHA
jgi:hypothetical protein